MKGTSCKEKEKRLVAPLEHVVRPEGNVVILTGNLINLVPRKLCFLRT
jgi:hypothetical protein